MMTYPRWKRRRKCMEVVLLASASCALAALLLGCGAGNVHLKGSAGQLFQKITGARAVTVSENTTIYGGETNACLDAHERRHQEQAAVIADALVAIGAIDDDPESRAAAWISVYSIEHLMRGYGGSRFEAEARQACIEAR